MKKGKPELLKKKRLINIAFVLGCLSLFAFLWLAPEETTTHLPIDDIHRKFYQIASKKEAEKTCTNCHADNKTAPLPEGHPPPYRCLFCHKRSR